GALGGDDGGEAAVQRADGALLDVPHAEGLRVGEDLLLRAGEVGAGRGDRVGGRRVDRVVHPVAQVGGDPGGGLAALLGADAADRQLGDAAEGEGAGQ